MKVIGRREAEGVERKANRIALSSSWLTLLSMQTIYADFMQIFIWFMLQ